MQVTALVNNRVPCDVLIDTGAAVNLISETLVRDLGLFPLPGAKRPQITGLTTLTGKDVVILGW